MKLMTKLLSLFSFDRNDLAQSGEPSSSFDESDYAFMQRALELAQQAELKGEVPVGALIVKNGHIIAEGYNQPITTNNPCAHAEVIALMAAGRKTNNYRLIDTTVYVTLEPCAMCAMALVHARVARVVYAASDPKTGAAGSAFSILHSDKNNHKPLVERGLLAEHSSKILKDFFKKRRAQQKSTKKAK
ncbi:MAG: tRNA adenosine(34) deaminase TadA [Kangiellaceae bacterium]|jgi:tRNA(adenine34) deaminase|nr:tRNA adenosine(34) deaminase TadA [Kangiellaceae bacterium]